MKARYSKEFVKAVERLSGKQLKSVVGAINGVIAAKDIGDIRNCKKIISLENVYRIRIGDLRAFFFILIDEDDTVRFEYLVSRGNAYDKGIMERLRGKR